VGPECPLLLPKSRGRSTLDQSCDQGKRGCRTFLKFGNPVFCRFFRPRQVYSHRAAAAPTGPPRPTAPLLFLAAAKVFDVALDEFGPVLRVLLALDYFRDFLAGGFVDGALHFGGRLFRKGAPRLLAGRPDLALGVRVGLDLLVLGADFAELALGPVMVLR